MGKRKIEELTDYTGHFAQDLSPEAYAFLRDVALQKSRYIFTDRVGKKKFGYCTHCKATFPTSYCHGSLERCPSCNSYCHVKAAGRSRKYLIDECYAVWYEKSVIEPETITARGIWCVRDYRRDYRKVETTTVTVAIYVFRPGKAVMFKRSFWYRNEASQWGPEGAVVYDFESTAKVYSLATQSTHSGQIPNCYSRDSIAAAVEGTPFRFSCWESYDVHDMTEFFALYAVAPCVEYLTKLRMRNLVIDKLHNEHTYGAINWKGKTLLSVLRMTKQQFKAVQSSKVRVTFEFLAAFRDASHNGNFTPAEAAAIADEFSDCLTELIRLAKVVGVTLRKAAAWAKKQREMKEGTHSYWSQWDVLRTWNDYLEECVKLRMDRRDESVGMPKSLHIAHQKASARIKHIADKELNERLRAQAKLKDKAFRFVQGGLIAFTATTAQELIDEGNALNHCVGSYAQRVADGHCVILFIRNQEELSTPFYTMEIRNGAVVQCRGRGNRDMTPEVKAFVEAFKAAKLTPKQKRPRTQYVAAMA